MLLSTEHNYLFIHVNKVAGNSIANALRRPTTSSVQRVKIRVDEILRAVGTGLERRVRLSIRLHNPLYHDLYKFLAKHIKAREVRELIGQQAYDRLFKFAFVRNPWDRVVSRYFFARGHASHALHEVVNGMQDFTEYVEWAVENTKPFLQTELVCDQDGQVIVDFIGKFENLVTDYSTICDRIGIPDTGLEHKNPSSERGGAGYRKHYDDRTRELVADFCRRDIETFGYEF